MIKIGSQISDSVKGIMWGLALGDALGKPVEFKHLWRIKEDYGPEGITNLPINPTWTDDTEMTFAVARALIKTHHRSVEEISTQIAEEFIVWLDNTGHSPGVTCMRGTFKYKNTRNWKESGIKGSKGCGSAMRVAPIGLFFTDLKKLSKVAYNSSLITHAHPTGLAASVGAAYLVRLALEGEKVEDWPQKVKKIVDFVEEPGKTEFCNAIDVAVKALEHDETEKAIASIGEGWIGEEAVAIALYCCLKYPEAEDFKKLLAIAVNHSGDSDSTGCIAGGIMGARHGFAALGSEIHDWGKSLRERDRMERMIEDIIIALQNKEN